MKKWYDNEISRGIMESKYLQRGETPEKWLDRVASIFFSDLRPIVRKALAHADILPAGRILAGAGLKNKRKVSLSNCYILPTPTDSLESIYETAYRMARIGSYGGGCGFALDNIRPKGATVNNSARVTTGPVSWLNLYDTTGSLIGQNGRHMAMMAGITCEHPDIEEILRAKQNNEKLASMNISIKLTNSFLDAAKKKEKFKLHFEAETGERIEKEINAGAFFDEFCKTQRDWGDPGAIFIDRVRSFNLLADYEDYRIDICNPCGEYYGNAWNSCNLTSINLYNLVDDKFTDRAFLNTKKLENAVRTAVRMLDETIDYGKSMQPFAENRTCIDDWRAIGVGVFGLADMLIAMGIKYGSKESLAVVSDLMEGILTFALDESAELAKQKGTFRRYDWTKTAKSPLLKAFVGTPVYDKIKRYGLRNGNLISIAPTGTISLLAGRLSGGCEPLFKIAYERTSHSMEDSGQSFFVYARSVHDLMEYHGIKDATPDEIKKRFPYIVESQDVKPMDRILLQAVMQDYVDGSISSTINLPQGTTVDEIKAIYFAAWQQGLKGVTVFVDGCKRGNILGVKKKKEPKAPPNMNTIEPTHRSEVTAIAGVTYSEHTACVPKMYVTVNKTKEGDTYEVFTNASSGCRANISTITRLTSLALRAGIKTEKVVEELRANQCPACQILRRQGKKVALSCANAIADAIETSQKGNANDTAENDSYLKCPECGKRTLHPEGKCVTCTSCGWSKCE